MNTLRLRRSHALLAPALWLAACNGSGSDSGPPQFPGGLWTGVTWYEAIATSPSFIGPGLNTAELFAISTEDGRIRIFHFRQHLQLAGTLTVEGGTFRGSLSAFAPPDHTWPDGDTVTRVSFRADLAERESMSGAWQSPEGSFGDAGWIQGLIELGYNAGHAEESSLGAIRGEWFRQDPAGLPSGGAISLTIDEAGELLGSDTLGCNYTGRIELPDTRYNVYEIDVVLSECGFSDGSYEGLATVTEDDNRMRWLILNIDNGHLARTFALH
jgi:hypothetical protein